MAGELLAQSPVLNKCLHHLHVSHFYLTRCMSSCGRGNVVLILARCSHLESMAAKDDVVIRQQLPYNDPSNCKSHKSKTAVMLVRISQLHGSI